MKKREWFQVGPKSVLLEFDHTKTVMTYSKKPGATLLSGSALVSLYYIGQCPMVVQVYF
jgi:hypothetical protein